MEALEEAQDGRSEAVLIDSDMDFVKAADCADGPGVAVREGGRASRKRPRAPRGGGPAARAQRNGRPAQAETGAPPVIGDLPASDMTRER